MTSLRLYGLKRCSTCVKATRWLEEHGVAYEFIDYRDQPVDPDTLEQWSTQLSGWEKLVNRASTTWRNLPAEKKSPSSDAEWKSLIAEFPTLIKRPVAVSGATILGVGFNEKKFEDLVGKHA